MPVQKLFPVPTIIFSDIKFFVIRNQEIETRFKIVHDFSKPFDDDYKKIDDLRFFECTFDKFPRAKNFTNFIPHLSSLFLVNCGLTKITREDLRGLEGLKILWLRDNKIEKLPKGLFEYTPNLENVSFFNNKIRKIDSNILDPLCSLKYFDLCDNVAIDVKFDIEYTDEGFTLEKFKEEIKKCHPIEKLKVELKNEIEAVKQENVKLKKKVAELEEKFKDQASDFKVIVNGKEFRVNKTLLKANSPMLAKCIDESGEAETLEVTDISTGTFEEVLKFMRTKIQPDENANLIELYAASAKLEMKELMNITAEILMQKINAENALDVMKLCQKFAHDKLHKKAFEEYKKNFE